MEQVWGLLFKLRGRGKDGAIITCPGSFAFVAGLGAVLVVGVFFLVSFWPWSFEMLISLLFK
jgi:hypothetical protein